MTKKYIHADENGNIHILSEDDLQKCPLTGGISPNVIIIGEPIIIPNISDGHIFCKSVDKDFEVRE